MNGKMSRRIRRLAYLVRPDNPRWAARWLRKRGGLRALQHLPRVATKTKYRIFRLAHGKATSERRGSFKR